MRNRYRIVQKRYNKLFYVQHCSYPIYAGREGIWKDVTLGDSDLQDAKNYIEDLLDPQVVVKEGD